MPNARFVLLPIYAGDARPSIQYAMSTLNKAGFIPIITPDMAKVDVLEGIGFIPRGPETQIYSVENTDLCLVATAEITLGGLHMQQVLDEARFPLKYVGLSHCFRTEAGAPRRRYPWPLPGTPIHQGRDVRL